MIRRQMVNLKRDSHFLPECYQRGFTDPTGRVWVKFATKVKSEHRNPRSVGKRSSLYIRNANGIENDKVEDFFSEAVESPFAALSRRIKDEQNQFRMITGVEQGILCRFVASQAVRTLAHRQCVDEQAGAPVDTNVFVLAMIKVMHTIWGAWMNSPPDVHFHTSLPHVAEQFITGDHPVVIIQPNDNLIWVPTDVPKLGVTSVTHILGNARSEFRVSLSPYICVSIRMQSTGNHPLPPETVDPLYVRSFNNLIRGQCDRFTMAKSKEFLV